MSVLEGSMFLKYYLSSSTLVELLDNPLRVGRLVDYPYEGGEWHRKDAQRFLDEYQHPVAAPKRWVYVAHAFDGDLAGLFKIGMTYSTLNKRMPQIGQEYKSHIDYGVAIGLGLSSARDLEKTLHYHYRDKRIIREWFALDGDDLADIRTLPNVFSILKDGNWWRFKSAA